MARSVKLCKDILKMMRREAEIRNGSVPRGQLRAMELTDSEATRLEEFTRKMAEPMADERRFFSDRNVRGLGVGTDASGHLIFGRDR